MASRFGVAMLALVVLSGCGSSTSPTLVPNPPPPGPGPTPVPTPVASPTPAPPGNRPPTGTFRFTPAPRANGEIEARRFGVVKVNAAQFQDPDGDRLYLSVDWGDGQKGRSGCGPCRVDHFYTRHGSYTIRASITDLTFVVQRAVTVNVD